MTVSMGALVKRTDELEVGDVVVLPRGVRRTVSSVTDSGWVNARDETIWTVSYLGGRTADWSAGNTGIGSSVWTVEL